MFEKQGYLFTSTYDTFTDQMKKAIERDSLERFLKELTEKPYIHNAQNHLGRTLLHVAVEKLNINFVRCFANVGFNLNAREKCGITPLIIAVILKNKELCQLLANARASVRGPLFTNVPSPIAIAKKMDLPKICDILDLTEFDEEGSELQCYDPSCHDWVGIIPGDLHKKGYIVEACYKEQGLGGFHYLVQKVMKRSRLTKEAFKKKKFADGNLS